MYWAISLAIFFALNESTFSWRSLSPGQVSCDFCLQRLLTSSSSFSTTTKKAATEINTWYPIPKWKVLFDGRRNRNGQTQTHFNKQGIQGTDGNIFGNSFSSISDLQKRMEVFRRLNIQFLPLKDGNITVNGSERKINDSTDVEFIALFVVYASFQNKNNGEILCNSSREFRNMKRENSRFYDKPSDCNFTLFKPRFKFNEYGGDLIEEGEKIASVPLTADMSIDMEIDQTDDKNYTIAIIPFSKNMTATIEKDRESKSLNGNITIKLSKNMNMILKTNQFYLNKNIKNDSQTSNLFDTKNFTDEFIDGESDNFFTETNLFEDLEYSTLNNSRNETVLGDTYSMANIVLNTTLESNTVNVDIETNTLVLETSDDFDNVSFVNINHAKEQNNTSRHIDNENNAFDTNTYSNFLATSTDKYKLKKQTPDEYESGIKTKVIEYKKINQQIYDTSKLRLKKIIANETKESLSSKSLFIAKISLTIFNDEEKDKTQYMIHVSSYKANYSDISGEISNKNSSQNFVSGQNIAEKNVNDTYSSLWQKYQKTNTSKGPVIKDELVSHDRNKTSNKYLSRTARMILNKSEEKSGETNPFSLILQSEKTKGQIYSRRLFLFQKVLDSYSSSTIANSNEEFNQKSTNNFRNKGVIRRKLPDYAASAYGSKSNQMAYDTTNKRKVPLLELIPNKDLGENRFVPKKSELQMVEGVSFDKTSDHWKMKIPSREQNLERNGIKTSKICELENGCRRINDAFNRKSELEYQKVNREKKHSFKSNGRSKVNKIVDQYMKINSHSQQNTPDERLRLNIDEIANRKISELLKKGNITQFKFWFDLDDLDLLQKSFLGVPKSSVTGTEKSKTVKFFNHNITHPNKKSKSFLNKTNGLHLETKRKWDGMRFYFTKQLVKKLNKPTKFLKRSVILKDAFKTSFPSLNHSRQKRSEQGRRKNYFKLINPNMSPRRMNPEGNSQSEYFSRLLSMLNNSNNTSNNDISRRTSKSPSVNKKSSTKRRSSSDDKSKKLSNSESTRRTQNKQNQWYSERQWDDNRGRNGPEFKWIIIFPEVIKSNNQNPLKSTSTESDKPDEKKKPSNPDRETEEYDYNDEVVIIDTSEEEQKKNESQTTPMPTEKPMDTSQTTARPFFPIPFSTRKTTRYPNFYTTAKPMSGSASWPADRPWSDFTPWSSAKPWVASNPWSNYQPWSKYDSGSAFRPWDFDGWRRPQNPWNRYGTAQMMMNGMSYND